MSDDRIVMKEDEVKTIYKLNCPDDVFTDNIKHSIRLQFPQVWPHEDQDAVIALVGGGPSLDDTIDDLIEKHEAGMKVVSMNGTHDYLLDHGIRPSVHMQVDARDFNARFVENWQEKTKYIMASQCHPKVFETLKGAEVYLFHAFNSAVDTRALDDYYMKQYVSVRGGSTVMLRAIPLMRMLGFKKMEIYGFDSCVMDKRHHAYTQGENDHGPVSDITVGGREFFCFAWMMAQANDFIDIVKVLGDTFELQVHGDGLIAHILSTSADKLKVK